MIRSRIFGVAAALAIAGGTALAFAPAAGATDLVSCTGLQSIAALNPTFQSNDARYVKTALKDSDGTKQAFLTNAPIPADALTCVVDVGIRTNNTVIDNGTGKYTLDDQSNGNAFLTTTGPLAKTSASVFGASSCNAADTVNVSSAYPDSYPLQGKTIWKFDQTLPTLANIQIQQYVRTARESTDPSNSNIVVTGIVIKGPGLGGDVDATLSFYPTNSIKNLNVAECIDSDVSNDTTEASLAELWISQADGTDAGTAVDPWTISIP